MEVGRERVLVLGGVRAGAGARYGRRVGGGGGVRATALNGS
jgi:hypothetical protein